MPVLWGRVCGDMKRQHIHAGGYGSSCGCSKGEMGGYGEKELQVGSVVSGCTGRRGGGVRGECVAGEDEVVGIKWKHAERTLTHGHTTPAYIRSHPALGN